MFTKARLTLTGWYVLLVMVISLFFSAVVYRGSTFELERSLRRQAFRTNTLRLPPDLPTPIDIEIFEEARNRIFWELVFFNGLIFFSSAFAAYFLAGRTLSPIEQMLSEQKRFVADASHELRTPLTVMKTEIEVALRDNKLKVGQAKIEMESNLEEVNKMQLLVNDLLSLSKYENDNSKYVFSKSSLEALIIKSIKNIKVIGDKKNIIIIYTGKDVQAEIVSSALDELINIMLDNAIKYSNAGTGVEVGLKSGPKWAEICIKDSGMGIKKEDIPFIFNRFYRSETSRNKNKTDGYGLGLSIAKKIVDLHLGSIEVQSEAGKGSEFKIKIPIKHSLISV